MLKDYDKKNPVLQRKTCTILIAMWTVFDSVGELVYYYSLYFLLSYFAD